MKSLDRIRWDFINYIAKKITVPYGAQFCVGKSFDYTFTFIIIIIQKQKL